MHVKTPRGGPYPTADPVKGRGRAASYLNGILRFRSNIARVRCKPAIELPSLTAVELKRIPFARDRNPAATRKTKGRAPDTIAGGALLFSGPPQSADTEKSPRDVRGGLRNIYADLRRISCTVFYDTITLLPCTVS